MLTIEINGIELSKDNHCKVKFAKLIIRDLICQFNTNTGLKMSFFFLKKKRKKKKERQKRRR
jgi:hypothetical protein